MKRENDINRQNTSTYSRLIDILGLRHVMSSSTDNCNSTYDVEKQRQLQSQIIEILNTLTDKEQQVMISIYGLRGEKKSYEELAADMGITKNELQEIEMISLRKMRSPRRLQKS